MKALVFCKVEHKAMAKVVEEFNKIPEIKKVFSLTGDYDVVAEVDIESMDELYDSFIKKIDPIEGIMLTNTHMVMREFIK
jgi:DNA-binding Lrp family transcriptional regulator